MSNRRALFVEDDESIREVVRLHLELAGFDVVGLGDGRLALEVGRATRFDIVVLDVMIPGIDGVSLCRALRAAGANQRSAILLLTARDRESDKVDGLDSGADDYLTKPFGVRELVSRIAALLRAQERVSQRQEETPTVSRAGIVLDLARRRAFVRGEPVDFTKQEFALLQLFLTHPGVVFSRDALLARVWGGDTYVTVRTVDAVISRIRRKIELDPREPQLLQTAWGVGYSFAGAD